MVDTWATVASCAQIGKRVHLSGGVGIGGVLEPPQAVPVVVEDDCFIGSRCMIVDGARVRQGAKLGAGVILTSSTPVIDSQTGEEVARGDIPERAVVVQGIRNKEFPGGTFGLPCALDPALPRRGRGARQAHSSTRSCASTASSPDGPAMTDLLALTEAALRDPVGERHRSARSRITSKRGCASARAGLEIDRVANNVIARTASRHSATRVVLGGHLDTVPANGNATPRRERDSPARARRAPT